jgi:hypothetical protein
MELAKVILVSFLLAAARGPAEGANADKTPPPPIPTVAATQNAIQRILDDPQVDGARPEYSLIFNFAQRSDQVEIALGEPFFAFSGNKKLDATLLAYYIAGAVRFDLTHPDLASNPRADVPDAIRAALVFYRKHRAAHPTVLHPLFERYDEIDRKGGLDDWARKVEIPPANAR